MVTLNCKNLTITHLFIFFKCFLGCFYLQSANFSCNYCTHVTEADKYDYVNSGFWPGRISSVNFLVAEEALLMWHHIQHKIPSASANKFTETLESFTEASGRVSYIYMFLQICLLVMKYELYRRDALIPHCSK